MVTGLLLWNGGFANHVFFGTLQRGMPACKQQYFRDWNLLSVGELIFPSDVSDHPHRTLLRKAGKCQTETMYYFEMGSRSAAFQ